MGRKQTSRFNFTYKYLDDVLSINNWEFTNNPRTTWARWILLILKSKTRAYDRQQHFCFILFLPLTFFISSFLSLLLLLSIGRDCRIPISFDVKHHDFHFCVTNVPFLSSIITLLPPITFLFHSRYDIPKVVLNMDEQDKSSWMFYSEGNTTFNYASRIGIRQECFKLLLKKSYGRYGNLTKHFEVPLLRMLKTFYSLTINNDTLYWSDLNPHHNLITYVALLLNYERLPLRRLWQTLRSSLLWTPGHVQVGVLMGCWACFRPILFKNYCHFSWLITSIIFGYFLECA